MAFRLIFLKKVVKAPIGHRQGLDVLPYFPIREIIEIVK
jgi:hypothetical protein